MRVWHYCSFYPACCGLRTWLNTWIHATGLRVASWVEENNEKCPKCRDLDGAGLRFNLPRSACRSQQRLTRILLQHRCFRAPVGVCRGCLPVVTYDLLPYICMQVPCSFNLWSALPVGKCGFPCPLWAQNFSSLRGVHIALNGDRHRWAYVGVAYVALMEVTFNGAILKLGSQAEALMPVVLMDAAISKPLRLSRCKVSIVFERDGCKYTALTILG